MLGNIYAGDCYMKLIKKTKMNQTTQYEIEDLGEDFDILNNQKSLTNKKKKES